jgi:hypothetical protein
VISVSFRYRGKDGGCGQELYKFVSLFQSSLGLSDGTFARLSRELRNLIQFLREISLNKLQLNLVRVEQLGACLSVKRIRHIGQGESSGEPDRQGQRKASKSTGDKKGAMRQQIKALLIYAER